MPKNKGKGGKGKRKGKRNKGGDAEKAELRFKVFGEEYGQVRRVLGNCRVEAYCFDGKVRLCHVRGKFKKRVWINKDDFVLVGLRDYQDEKGDIIHKYTTEEARLLRSWGEIPADKANFDDDGALSGGEDVFLDEDVGGEGGSSDDSDDDDDDDSSSGDELFQPNNNRNLPVGEEESSDDDESEEESSDEEDMFAASKSAKNNKQSSQAILKAAARNNNKSAPKNKPTPAKAPAKPAPAKAPAKPAPGKGNQQQNQRGNAKKQSLEDQIEDL